MDKIKLLDGNSSRVAAAGAKSRAFLNAILDVNSFVESDVFTSGTSYLDGADALGEGVVTGYGAIYGRPVYVFCENPDVMKGSIGKAHADKILKCMSLASKNSTPFIAFIDSAGARVGEGISVIEAYSSLIAAASDLSGSVPFVSVIKGNCTGLLSAFASISDFVFMGDNSVMSLSSPMVVMSKGSAQGKPQDILGVKNHAEKTGEADFTYKTEAELKDKLAQLFDVLMGEDEEASDDPNRTAAMLNKTISVDKLLAALCDDGKYLSYREGFAKEASCVLARVNGVPVGIAVSDAKVSPALTLSGARKLASFVRMLDSYDMPFISLVDYKGIESSADSEQCCAIDAAKSLLVAVADSRNAKISVITGSAIGYAYSALCSKAIGYDYSLAFCDSVISPIAAETAVAFEYSDEIKAAKDPVAAREKLEKKYGEEAANPFICAKDGYIDNIIEPAALRPYVSNALLMLLGI